MASELKSLFKGIAKLATGDAAGAGGNKAALTELFPKVSKDVDGDDCDHDCQSCAVQYPAKFKIDEDDALYGHVKGWSTHVLVATGKTDWVRDVADEKGSVMEAINSVKGPSNGRLMLSASNMPTPHGTPDYSGPTNVLLLPAFTVIEKVTPASVPALIEAIEKGPTNTSPPEPQSLPPTIPVPLGDAAAAHYLTTRACPHRAIILLCSQRTRDARCGQSAPLLRKELQRHLQPLGLYRDLDDERPGGVGIYFISHVGGHKYSANVMVYRRPNAFGVDEVSRAELAPGEEVKPAQLVKSVQPVQPVQAGCQGEDKTAIGDDDDGDVGAVQGIWLARIKPEDCEGLVKFTVLQGKVVKPEKQLRGGFDRSKGLLSW